MREDIQILTVMALLLLHRAFDVWHRMLKPLRETSQLIESLARPIRLLSRLGGPLGLLPGILSYENIIQSKGIVRACLCLWIKGKREILTFSHSGHIPSVLAFISISRSPSCSHFPSVLYCLHQSRCLSRLLQLDLLLLPHDLMPDNCVLKFLCKMEIIFVSAQ